MSSAVMKILLLAGAAVVVVGGGYWLVAGGPEEAPAPTAQTEPAATPEPAPGQTTAEAPAGAETAGTEPAVDQEPSTAAAEPAPAEPGGAEPAEVQPAEASSAATQEPAPSETAEPESAEPGPTQPEPATEAPAVQVVAVPEPSGEAEIDMPDALPPSFDIVRVEPSGEAVIAGRAEPGSLIVLKDGAATIGETRADGNGDWVVIPRERLAPGSHQLSLSAQTPTGEILESRNVVVVAVPAPAAAQTAESETPSEPGPAPTPLAVLAPRDGEGASEVLQRPEPQGISDRDLVLSAIDYDSEGRVVISGRATPGATVLLYLDNLPIGEVVANDGGTWALKPTAEVSPGLHRLRLDQIDGTGQVVARIETPFSRADALLDLPDERFVIVQPGNALWRIARRTYGEGPRYSVIYESNQAQIRDPDLIYPGQIFKVPEVN